MDEPGPSNRIEPTFFHLPQTIHKTIFGNLRTMTPKLPRNEEFLTYQDTARNAEQVSLCEAFPNALFDRIHENEQKTRNVRKWNNFKWFRHFAFSSSDSFTPRSGSAVVYHEKDNAIYLFGGRSLPNHTRSTGDRWDSMDNLDRMLLINENNHNHVWTANPPMYSATFNDLWKLSLADMKWSRVVVPRMPYPSARDHATVVVHKDSLILYGGTGHTQTSRTFAVPRHINEVHIFNIEQKQWDQLIPIVDGPALSHHSAVIAENLMICYGGRLSHEEYNSTFRVLNLQTSRWFTPIIPGLPQQCSTRQEYLEKIPESGFPCYELGTGSLFLLAEGVILLYGQRAVAPFTMEAAIVKYNHDEPQTIPWSIRIIQVTGNIWELPPLPRVAGENGQLQPEQPPEPRRHPNSQFHQIVAFRDRRCVRLVTVGYARTVSSSCMSRLNTELMKRRDRKQNFVRAAADFFVRRIQSKVVERELLLSETNTETEKEEEKPSCYVNLKFANDGITLYLNNCIIPVLEKLSAKQALSLIRAKCKIDGMHNSADGIAPLDEVDLIRMEKRIILHLKPLYMSLLIHNEASGNSKRDSSEESRPGSLTSESRPCSSRESTESSSSCRDSTVSDLWSNRPPVSCRKRLIAYTATLPLDPELLGEDHLTAIDFTASSMSVPSPYHYVDSFTLTAVDDEAILFGGVKSSSETNGDKECDPGTPFTYCLRATNEGNR